MSLAACIDGLVEEGALTRAQASHAKDIYGEMKLRRRQTMGDAAAEAAASEDTLAALAFQAAETRRVKLLQQDAQVRAIRDQASYDGGRGGTPGASALALLDHDAKATYDNVAMQRQVILGKAHAIIGDVLDRFKRDLLGRTPEPAALADIEREMRGERTGNASARELADAIEAAGEYLRRRFNQAGGAIGKLENRGAPQHHDSVTIREAGYATWRDTIVPMLDRVGMVDETTGLAFTDAGLERALKAVFKAVTEEGRIDPFGQGGGKKLSSTRAEHRFIKFRSADDAMAYRERFGGGVNLFEAMTGEFDGLARDIAHMERLGPNPSATIRFLQAGIINDAAINGRRDTLLGGSAKGEANRLQALYDVTSGRSAIPVNAAWARSLGGARSAITAAKLGGAVVSAISDTGFQIMTRHFNGLPIMGAVSDHLKLMTRPEYRKAAVRMGLVAEDAAHQAAGIARYIGESMAPGIAARLADGVLRVSGLNAWTQTGKWSFGIGLLGHLADVGHLELSRLDAETAGMFSRYGIDGAAWDAIRTAERTQVEGADFVDPTRIAHGATGDRLLRMILTETSYAVPEVSARARALTTWGEPGTLRGEASRSILQFKSFGVSMLMTHGRRMMSLTPYNGAKYAAGLFVTTTLLGAMSIQAKEIVKGKDPRPMDDWHFWKDAALQAGGFGIFGDFIGNALAPLEQASGTARAGSLPELLAGPLVGAVGDAARLGISPFLKSESDPGYGRHVGREVVRDLKGYTPGASLWYARLVLERLVFDQLQSEVDPNHARSWDMMERAATQRGQGYYWKPGETTPERAPQLGDALNPGAAARPERQAGW